MTDREPWAQSEVRKALTTMGACRRDIPAGGGYSVGAELESTQIRAGVFDASGCLLGKAQRSPKPERGAETVMQRVARCMADAVDECDLGWGGIAGASLGIFGNGTGAKGDPGVLRAGMEAALAAQVPVPVRVELAERLAALGIHAIELEGTPGMVVVLACLPELHGVLLVNGEFPAAEACKPLRGIVETARHALGEALPDPALGLWSRKDLRKAARHREPRVRAYGRVLAERLGAAAVQVDAAYPAERIVLSGGVLDELRGELLPIVLETARRQGRELSAKLAISELADNAVLAGGALAALGAVRPGDARSASGG
ncbi:MAG: ROK family protein [Verrucomicrobia bacterium]|nr:ROK family protein [Verrucomicrobiota bacterium]